MGNVYETSIPSAAITATGTSTGITTGAVNFVSPPKLSQGFTSGLFCQEITAVSALTTWDEKIQFLLSGQTSYADLLQQDGQILQFPQATGTGLSVLLYLGGVPSTLRANYELVGTSVTRIIPIMLAS